MSAISNSKCIYLNSNYLKESEALISVRDRGFRFGDGVFETIRVEGGRALHWELHERRLEGSLRDVKIYFDITGLKEICDELLRRNDLQNGFLRIAVSRGEGSNGYLPKGGIEPTLVVETVDGLPSIDEAVDLWVSSYRKIPDVCLPPHAKTAQGLNSTLARMEAQENSCFEALLLSVDGKICEGSSGNIFWFKQGKLYTPKSNILHGTVRELVIAGSPYEVVQGDFELGELQTAEEVFLTNVAWLVAPVRELKPLGWKWGKGKVAGEVRELVDE